MPLGGHVPSYRTLSSQLRPWGTRPTNTARGRIESIGTQGMISAYLERKFSRPRAGPGNQKVRDMTKMKTLAVLKLNDSNHLEFAGALISTMLGKREILPIIMPTGKNTGSIGNKTTSTVQSLTVAAEAEHS
ncbi:hypothetical protein UVI_02005240 [Ustilaginoidea virens]|uniref:Uncharacterized protein n=1 Tax=Ustilaginoidea virens TaxID=1159556 RepID=A0A1B5KUY5_USTVR|nr:hypothetical protein UVI_02005240 [Ustilaginoidea virens]